MTSTASRSPARAASLLVATLSIVLGLSTPAARAADDPVDGLKRGLRSTRAEARAEAARGFAGTVRILSEEDRRRAALALREAAKTEGDPTARLEEFRALAALDDATGWVPVLVAAVSDKVGEVREGAERLVLVSRSGVLAVVRKLLKEDDDPTFRAGLLLLVGRRRRADAVPLLLDAMADPHARVSAAAVEALEAVTGEALGYDPAAWRAWWEKGRPADPVPAGPSPKDPVTREPAAPEPPKPPPPPRGLIPEFFGLPVPSKDLVFVIDVSGSVGAGGFDGAKTELLKAVERLGSDVRIAALFFDETVVSWHPEMVRATPEAKADLARFVRGIPRGKHTDVMTPLNAGLQIVRRRVEERAAAKEPAGERVTMYVVSDGQENVRATPGEAVGDKLDRLDLAHAVVHAICIGGKGSALLLALARRGGGRYLVIP